MNTYQAKAHATRSRRQAAGLYKRPNQAQKAAYAKLVSRGGEVNLTQADAAALAAHPWLTASQRSHYADLAASVNWS